MDLHYQRETSLVSPVCGQITGEVRTTGRFSEATCRPCQQMMLAEVGLARSLEARAVEAVRVAAARLDALTKRVVQLETELGLRS